MLEITTNAVAYDLSKIILESIVLNPGHHNTTVDLTIRNESDLEIPAGFSGHFNNNVLELTFHYQYSIPANSSVLTHLNVKGEVLGSGILQIPMNIPQIM